jgi:phosphatidylinositol alpha 1,6-mannosyltransferase
MRVALFSEAVPPIRDGSCYALTQLAASMDAEGIRYRFISGIEPSPELTDRVTVHKVPSVPFPGYGYYRISVPVDPRLDRALDRFRPDIIHAANPTLLGLYALVYGRRRRLPVVTSYHTNYVSYFPYYGLGKLQGLGWWLLRRFHSRCRATYAPSRSTVEALRSRGIPRVDLWPRGVRLDRFGPGFRSEELRRSIGAEALPVLLYVGRLVREKDLADLARAVEILRGRGLRFRTVLVGEGPMGTELRARLPEAVFAGFRMGDDLARWYASADVFVFPSTTETFGNVILEAFASGLPVVGVRASGSQDLIVPGENGLLADPRDPVDFADRVEGLLSDPAGYHAMREGALRTVHRFDWGAINRRLITDYDRVIREHRSPVREGAMELAAG